LTGPLSKLLDRTPALALADVMIALQ
jgi:hypothetical protein